MCGIIGVLGSSTAAQEVGQGLLMLQHRGQDSAGILSVDPDFGKFHMHKAMGHVSQVFPSGDSIRRLAGNAAIGHTRYSTLGDVKESDLQPIALSHPVGIGAVHNGNLSNYNELRAELILKRRVFMTDNDLEVILQLFADGYGVASGSTLQRVSAATRAVLKVAEGGYSVVGLLGSEGLFAFRDPHGIRPLILGKRLTAQGGNAYALASESCALTFLGYQVIRDVRPGELIWIDENGMLSSVHVLEKKALPCMFEWVYFSGADSTLEEKSVSSVRLKLGERLAARIRAMPNMPQFDIVAPVPETARPAAIALSENLGIPFRDVLIKNRYVQRSFILNGQDRRKVAVNLKFSVVDSLVRGKSILLVDDSIVRGTTSARLIELLRDHGARQVYFASTCPPITHPCFYGIDFPTPEELIATSNGEEGVAVKLGANGVFYASMEDLSSALGGSSVCSACLTGQYPYPTQESETHA